MHSYTRESQRVKEILDYVKRDVGSTKENGGYKQYKLSLICTELSFIVF